MSSLPIAPDESSGVPRCSIRCPSRLQRTTYSNSRCDMEWLAPDDGHLCLPRVRELVAISRRRCDGCRRYVCGTAMHGHCPIRGDAPPPDGVCENWEAKP